VNARAPSPGRGPLRALLDEWVLEKRVPAGCGFLRALGTALLIVLLSQAVTGMFLALAYSPSPDHAYDAIRAIDDDAAGGRLLRGMHHWGASAVMLLAFFHMARVFVTGAYKRPRQLLWLVGVAIFGVLGGFGFTGYLLPWDMKAFWATDVGLNIVSTVPLVGGWLADLLRGGPEIGAPTLARMFALHVLFLPALLLPLAGLHLLLVHKLGITPPGARVGEPEVKSDPFFPDHVLKELLVATAALAVVLALAWKLGPPLEAPASRDAQGYLPRPEWYFLGLFQLLKYFEGPAIVVGTALIPGTLTLLLVLAPWLDRSPERAPSRRKLAVAIGSVLFIAFGALTIAGAMDKGSHVPPPPRVRVGDGSYVPPPSPPIEPPAKGSGASKEGGTKPEAASGGKPVSAGEALMRKYECLRCHTLRGEGDELGSGAPAFERAAKGHDRAWLEALLLEPKKFHKDTEMPSAKENDMGDADRKALAGWLLEVLSEK
jgi:quinol-cytochrome oxidoreductase complex cytochrome b subunit/mono/diheme cytochrome c family protein